MSETAISAGFPFESKYIEVHGSRMHYIDEGEGDPILFLHGNPTSSYLWRNIVPYLVPHGRCIAPDLIGMGKSDKPNIAYRFFDHVHYTEGFIRELGLTNVTLVVHDWGSALGFHYAMRHETNIKGLAIMEAIIKPVRWQDFPKEMKLGFKMMRTPVIGWFLICVMNLFIKKILPQSIVRPLTREEMGRYEAPFQTPRDRMPVRRWPCEIPVDGSPADVHAVVADYNHWLQQSDLPKLLFTATPGAIINSDAAEWCRRHLRSLTVCDLGEGIHYLQEDHPHAIGRELAAWYAALSG